jgi:DNA-binding GntR family transcriptional regulator
MSLSAPRASIRTAIVRLAQENLVERLPNRGARVRRITEKEAVELLETRIELECLVARHAAQNATFDDVARLKAILATMQDGAESDALTYTETNTQLHREIARIADHQTAERLLEDLRSRNTVFQFRTVIFPNEPTARIQQHCAIVDAIAAHDQAAATEAMRRHLSDVANRMRARLKQERDSLTREQPD